jgi:hypothetical protein
VVAIGCPAANPVRVLPGCLPQLSTTLDVETLDCSSLGRRDQDCFSYHSAMALPVPAIAVLTICELRQRS